jgi:hypothetical protein
MKGSLISLENCETSGRKPGAGRYIGIMKTTALLRAGLGAAAILFSAACASFPQRQGVAQTRPHLLANPPPSPRGGWYALNYHYYWGQAPPVDYDDPYDYNGNYFPLAKAR